MAETIVIAPSNPIVSIGPLRALRASTTSCDRVASAPSPCRRSSAAPP